MTINLSSLERVRGKTSPRRSQRITHVLIGWLALGLSLPLVAEAGGLYVNELSSTSQGNAGAGRGAWVPDASATIHNPASMTELDDHGFAGGLTLAFGDVQFDPSSTSPSGSRSGSDQVDPFPLASFSYVHKASDRVRLGLSFFASAGSALDPNDSWAGRFQMTEISLAVISISPSIAVRVTDWLSIGGGPIANYGLLDWDLRVAPLLPPGPERDFKLDDLDDWEASGQVGILLTPREDLSLSVLYRSETDFDLSGNLRIPSGISPSLDLELVLAQLVEVSAHWQVNEKLGLLATFNWEDWSGADGLTVGLAGRTITAQVGWEDTYKIGVGANYRIADDWLLQTGITYDTSALKNKVRTTALPVDEQVRFSLGALYDITEATTLGLSFTYANLGQGEIRSASVRGDYEDNHLFMLGFNVAFNQLPWSGKLTMADSNP
jgi:long-chain fatty acid transport protein